MQVPFGRAINPIRAMEADHNNTGDLLKVINALTDNFSLPEDSYNKWMFFYEALQAFEGDLHKLIYLENNILFPKTVYLEKSMKA